MFGSAPSSVALCLESDPLGQNKFTKVSIQGLVHTRDRHPQEGDASSKLLAKPGIGQYKIVLEGQVEVHLNC